MGKKGGKAQTQRRKKHAPGTGTGEKRVSMETTTNIGIKRKKNAKKTYCAPSWLMDFFFIINNNNQKKQFFHKQINKEGE